MYVFESATRESRYLKRRARSPIDFNNEPGLKRECIKCHVRKPHETRATANGSKSNLGYNSILNIPTAQINLPKLGPVVDFVNQTINQLKLISEVQHLTDLGKKAGNKTENVTKSKSDYGIHKLSHEGRKCLNRQSCHQDLCLQKNYEKVISENATEKKLSNHYTGKNVDQIQKIDENISKLRRHKPNIQDSTESIYYKITAKHVDDKKNHLYGDPTKLIVSEKLPKSKNVKNKYPNLNKITRSEFDTIGGSIFNELHKQTAELFWKQKNCNKKYHDKLQKTLPQQKYYSVADIESFTDACHPKEQFVDRSIESSIHNKSHKKDVAIIPKIQNISRDPLVHESLTDSFLEYDTIEKILSAADELLNKDVIDTPKKIINRRCAHSRNIQKKKSKLPVKVDSLILNGNRSIPGNKIAVIDWSSSSDEAIINRHNCSRPKNKQINCSLNYGAENRRHPRVRYQKHPNQQNVINNQSKCNIRQIFHEMGYEDRERLAEKKKKVDSKSAADSVDFCDHQAFPYILPYNKVSGFIVKNADNLEKQTKDSTDVTSIQKETSDNRRDANFMKIPSSQYSCNLRKSSNRASKVLNKTRNTPTSIIDDVLQSIRSEMQYLECKRSSPISQSNKVIPAYAHSCQKIASCHHSICSGYEKEKVFYDPRNDNNKHSKRDNSKYLKKKKDRRGNSTLVENSVPERLTNQSEEKPTRDVELGDGKKDISCVKNKHDEGVDTLSIKSRKPITKVVQDDKRAIINHLKSIKDKEIYKRNKKVLLKNSELQEDKSPSYKKCSKESLSYFTSSDSMRAPTSQVTSIDKRRQSHHNKSKQDSTVMESQKGNIPNLNAYNMNLANSTKIGVSLSNSENSCLLPRIGNIDVDIFPEKDFTRNIDGVAVSSVVRILISFPKFRLRVKRRPKKLHSNRLADKHILKKEMEKRDCLGHGGCRTFRSPSRRSFTVMRLSRKFNKPNEVHDFLRSFTKVLNKSSDEKCRAIKSKRDIRQRRNSSGVISTSKQSNAEIKSDSVDCAKFLFGFVHKDKLIKNETPDVITLFENSDEVESSKMNKNSAFNISDNFDFLEEHFDLELSTQKTPLTTTDEEGRVEDSKPMSIFKKSPSYFTEKTKNTGVLESINEPISFNEKSGSDGEFENCNFYIKNPYGATIKESSHTLLLELENALRGVESSSSLTNITASKTKTKETKKVIHRANSTENILVLQAGDASTMLTLDAESTKNVNGAIIYKVVDDKKDSIKKKRDQDYIQRWAGYEDFNFSYFPIQHATVAYTLSAGEQYSNSFITQIEELDNILLTANAMIYRTATTAYVVKDTYFARLELNKSELNFIKPTRTATRTLISGYETLSNNAKSRWKNVFSIMTQIDTYDVNEVAILIGFRNAYTSSCILYYFAAVFNVIDIYYRPIQYDLIRLSSTNELRDFLNTTGVFYSVYVNEDGILTTSKEIVAQSESQEEHVIETSNLESVSTSTPKEFFFNTKGVQASLHGYISRHENQSFYLDTSSDNEYPAVVRLSTTVSSEQNHVSEEYTSTQESRSNSYDESLDDLIDSDFTICDDDSEPKIENSWPKNLCSVISLYRKQIANESTSVSDDKMSKLIIHESPLNEVRVCSVTSATNTERKPKYEIVSKKSIIKVKRRLLIFIYTMLFTVMFTAITSTRIIAC